ncbi:MAG: hypothetical protein IIB44_03505 [Candidatus Marinimicrobia bacterium]|nr:hypothetical protein [Candidatus Neomarinimicrobiota bacterium]
MHSSSNINPVINELTRFRSRKIVHDLLALAWVGMSVFVSVIILLLGLESTFWFSTSIRYNLWWGGLLVFIALIFISIITFYLIINNRISRYSYSALASEVGKKSSDKSDEILNALQLASSRFSSTSRSLALKYVSGITSKLQRLDTSSIYRTLEHKRKSVIFAIIVIISLLISAGFQQQFSEAFKHWIHPRTNFPIPYPFTLRSVTGDLSLMGGDNATIKFNAKGSDLEFITIELSSPEKDTYLTLSRQEDGSFVHEMEDVFQNIHYRGFVQSSHFWQPWDEISSPTYTIEVIDRPIIEDFVVTITPPDYTNLKPVVQKGNIAEIRGLKGSELSFLLKADKKLSRAYFDFTPLGEPEGIDQIVLNINGRKATGSFLLLEDGTLISRVFDRRNTSNLDPIEYHLMVLDDTPPGMDVIQPETPSELGTDFTIPIQLHIEDDFGFSNLQIVYEVKHPDYLSVGKSPFNKELVNIQTIPELSHEDISQEVYYLWTVEDLNLMPEDEIRFHFELYDNDTVSGPKKAVSHTLITRFPSIADLFARTVEKESEVQTSIEEMIEELESLDQSLESVELDLLKNRELNWEQEQILKKSLEEMREKVKNIQDLQEQVKDIIEQSEKHNLFSDELLEKFRDLNDLLSEIITPELIAAMEQLQSSMEQPSAQDLMDAIRDLQSNTAAMEAQLDRFIEIFKRIQAEQRIDELVARMESLVKRQQEIVNKVEKDELTKNPARLIEDQERTQQEFENLRDAMDDAADIISEFAKLPGQELKDLSQSELTEQTSQDLLSALESLESRNSSMASEMTSTSLQDLQQMVAQLQNIQSQFQMQTIAEMSREFDKIFQNTLYLSKHQEALHQETSELSHNSPRLGDMAGNQQLLKDQLAQLTQSVLELSRKTFSVTPKMGKALGRSSAGMSETINKLENRNGKMAARSQKETVGALNDLALSTLSAMDAMQQSGMASGFEQFLKRMEQMAGQQQGINSMTFQLAMGQMAASSKEGMMKRLGQEQGQLKKSLQQMIREMRGSQNAGGNLGGIVQDMEEVIKDFNRRRVTRKTIDRQQRILSRMLDSQKSMRQRDLSEKRRSFTGEDIFRTGPEGLPEDMGQRRNLAMEALNLALKAGYPRDYQDMIRRYFNALAQSPQMAPEDE